MSNQTIAIKINRDKIDPKRLFKGAKGTYLDAVLIPTPDSKYGEDWMVVQSVSREERKQGIKGAIIGSAKLLVKKGATPINRGAIGRASEEAAAKPVESSDLPF